MLLIRPQSHCPENDRGGGSSLPEGFQRPPPTEIVRQVLGGDAVEAAQPFLQSAVLGVDVVEVVVRRQWVWLARPRQDMRDDLGPPREGDDGTAAVAAERVGLGDDAIQSRSD